MKNKIWIITLAMILACFGAYAEDDNTAGSSSDSNLSYIINVGGGLGVVFGGFAVNYVGTPDWNQTETTFELGGTFVANFGITFDVGKEKKWSVGPAIQLGYNGQAGPSMGASVKAGGTTKFYTPKEMYGDMTVGSAKHAFITDIDFMARYSFQEDRRLVLQAGLRMGAAVPGVWWAYKGDSDGDLADEAQFIVGPNIFFGADCVFGGNFLLEYGLRFSAAFYSKEEYGITTVASYLDFAFELKFNYQNHVK